MPTRATNRQWSAPRATPSFRHVLEQAIQPAAADVLHRVIRQAVLLADGEDGDDVRVVELRDGHRLALEPLPAPGVEQPLARDDLQRDLPGQRFLERLVDDPHPAAPQLADDPVLAQALQGRLVQARAVVLGRTELPLQSFHHGDRGKELADLASVIGISPGIIGDRGRLAMAATFGELLGHPVEGVAAVVLRVFGGQSGFVECPRLGHVASPPKSGICSSAP